VHAADPRAGPVRLKQANAQQDRVLAGVLEGALISGILTMIRAIRDSIAEHLGQEERCASWFL